MYPPERQQLQIIDPLPSASTAPLPVTSSSPSTRRTWADMPPLLPNWSADIPGNTKTLQIFLLTIQETSATLICKLSNSIAERGLLSRSVQEASVRRFLEKAMRGQAVASQRKSSKGASSMKGNTDAV